MQEKFRYITSLSKIIKYKVLELSQMEEQEYLVFVYSIIAGKMKENICEKLIIDRNKYKPTVEWFKDYIEEYAN